MSIFDRLLMQQYTDSKFGQIKRIEMVEGDPVNPEEDVLYLVHEPLDIPPDFFFRFDAMELELADSAKVVSWTDLSGKGNDVSQGSSSIQPTYLSAGLNGKPTVQFSGSQYLEKSGFALDNLDGFTVFLVTDITATGSCTAIAIGEQSATLNDQTYALRYSGSEQLIASYINNNQNALAKSTVPSGAAVYTVTYDSASNKIYSNGVLQDEALISETLIAHDTLRVGARVSGALEPYNGNISELIYYSRPLASSEIAQVNNYLMEKWGI